MKIFRYFFEYILIVILFGLFKFLGYKISSEIGCFLGKIFGPFFRSKKIIKNNLIKFDNSLTPQKIRNILKEMWGNYGRILSEYPYISSFRKGNLDEYIKIENIPLSSYKYVINGKSAIEWVMERQRIVKNDVTKIINNANDYASETIKDPKYPLKLLLKVISLSIETQKLINKLPKL